LGDEHALQPLPSRLHSKEEPASEDENEKLADVALVLPEGPPVIVVSGAAVSIVHVRDAGSGSTLPAASVARTSKVCEPALRPA
jgi:hypothetical protein